MCKIRPGLTCFRDGVRQIPIESIPGVLETGWKPEMEKGWIAFKNIKSNSHVWKIG